jgi:hypothetical protein
MNVQRARGPARSRDLLPDLSARPPPVAVAELFADWWRGDT